MDKSISEDNRVSFSLIKVLTIKSDWYFLDWNIVTEIGIGFGGNHLEFHMGQSIRIKY
jgi:hypothetical protein